MCQALREVYFTVIFILKLNFYSFFLSRERGGSEISWELDQGIPDTQQWVATYLADLRLQSLG